MTKMEMMLHFGFTLHALSRGLAQTCWALKQEEASDPMTVRSVVAHSEIVALHLKTLITAEDRGVLDATFSLVERHNDPMLVLGFTDGELGVKDRDGAVYAKVSNDGDILSGVHNWLGRTQPDSDDLVVPGPVGFMPGVHKALADLLEVYKNR